MTADNIERASQQRTVRFTYTDPSGVIRARATTGEIFPGKVFEGVGLTRAQQAVNVFEDYVPAAGLEPVGEVRLVPDMNTFVELPWLSRTGSVICDVRNIDGSEWGGCTRSVLKRQIALAAQEGINIAGAFESEFYAASGTPANPQPWNDGPSYSTATLDRASALLNDIVDNLQAQGVVVEQAINEYGPGQLEVTTRWADILKAADTFVTLRDTVRGTAEVAHGLMASFSPKPYPDAVGSGAHLHLSAWCDGANLFFNRESPREISVWGGHFIAGVLDHLPALVALTCPSFVSYERLKPQMWAGAVAAWGYDNRECPVRVASSFAGREENSANVEIKSVDASANPYLAAAGIIAAGLDGVRRELVPPAPAWHDPATLSPAERQACGVRDLPHSQDVALNLLEADEVLMAALGDLMGPLYLAVRRAEFERATAEGLAWAREHTFNVY